MNNYVEEIDIHKRRKSNNKDGLLLLAKYSNIGYYLLTPLVLGVVVGLGLDRFFETKPLFTFLLIIIGFISTIFNLIKIVRET